VIRPADPADTPDLLAFTAATGFFKPLEIATLEEVLADYHLMTRAAGDRCFVLEEEGVRLGFVYHAAEPMTENTWSLWWIVVRPEAQGKGVGARLLKFTEADAREHGARVLFIETSGLPKYESTCRFYRRHGYEQEARLRDYYAPGDDMLVFRKQLATT
jgi:ribosomal protein S18 acetylase RimI-like enzyme